MGIYWTSTALIGYRIKPIKTYDMVWLPNCEHNPGSVKYCPSCGKAVGNHPVYSRFEPWDEFVEFLNEKGLPENYTYAFDHQNEKDGVFVGYGKKFNKDEDPSMLPLKPADDIKVAIMTFLQPWSDKELFTIDDKDFGFWTMEFGY